MKAKSVFVLMSLILSLALEFSCQQNSNRKITNKITVAPTKKISLDSKLIEYLDTCFKGWTLPEANRWDSVWYNQYNYNGCYVNYLKGDFDCNNHDDYAMIFLNENNSLLAYAFLSQKNTFKKVLLLDLGKDTNQKIDFGLEMVTPGKIHYMDPESEDAPFVILKCCAIQIVNFEKGAETFYWESGKLKSVMTGD